MNRINNINHLLHLDRLGWKRPALAIGPVTLTLVALTMVATMSFGAPVVKAASSTTQDEYAFLIDNPEMILVSHYPAGSESAFLVANPEMILVSHYPAGSETAFLADNPEMVLVSHYPAGSEAALLVANPELIIAHMYYDFNAQATSGL